MFHLRTQEGYHFGDTGLVLVQYGWQPWFNLRVTAYCPERGFTFPGSSALAAILTLGSWSNKTSYFCGTGYMLYPYFLNYFLNIFLFNVRLLDSLVVKTLLLFTFLMHLRRVKYLKCLRTRKYILEHKYEWNLSLVWLYLVIVTFYVNCLDRVVLAHQFWALAIFPICYCP